MGNPFDFSFVDQLIFQGRAYFSHQIFSWAMAVQVVVVASALAVSFRAYYGMNAWLTRLRDRCATDPKICAEFPRLTTFTRVIRSLLGFLVLAIIFAVAEHFNWPRDGLFTAGIILIALTLIRLIAEPMQNRFWSRILIVVIWIWAALNIFHLIEPWLAFQSHVVFNLGGVKISLHHVFRSILGFLVLYWLALNLSIIWRFWLRAGSRLSPAAQILLDRLGTIFFFTAAVFLVLTYLGLDLTVFALFGGALGLGLGFGLQKIFANLVSGFILLADKSIKPGDVIQLGDKYGWINFLGTRYISVITRNGTEHLIPNEKLITGEVINWSYSQNLFRLKVPVGVDYATDLEKARDLMLESAAATERVLKDPEPSCHLVSFGDNAINLELRVWINDPAQGIGSVKSNLLWGIWRRFKDQGIEMPYPQRDVHLKSIPEVRVRTGPEEG